MGSAELLASYLVGIAASATYESGKGISRLAFSNTYHKLTKELTNDPKIHLRRATFRALSIASLSLLKDSKDPHLADLNLDQKGVYIPRPETRYQSLKKLTRHLEKSVVNLKSQDATAKNFDQQNYQTTIQKTIDTFSVDDSDSINTLLGSREQSMNELLSFLETEETDDAISSNLLDWSSIADSPLHNFSLSVVDILIALGDWDGDRAKDIHNYLLETLFSESQPWYKAFALSFLNEVIDDQSLFAYISTVNIFKNNFALNDIQKVINTLNSDLNDKIDALHDLTTSLQATLNNHINDLRQRFKLCEEVVFTSLSNRNAGAYLEMHFSSEYDDFVGRKTIIDSVELDFLGQEDKTPKFKWLTFTGEAGSGKSRLALELISKYRTDWPIAGFVKSNFIEKNLIDKVHADQISSPTIFVIDYATRFTKQTLRFLERCEELQHSAHFPIRVILIMRRFSEQLFNTLEVYGDYGCVYAARFPIYKKSDNKIDGIIKLEALGDEELLKVMRGRLGEQPNDISDERLLKLLTYYDFRKRPLIAALVADALRYNTALDSDVDIDNETSRLELFRDYHRRNYLHRLKYTGDKDINNELSKLGEKQINKHISFALLSTMVRGITDTSLERLYKNMEADCLRLLPCFVESGSSTDVDLELDESGILATILGAERTDSQDPYPPLEPDLMGESLVIHFLSGNTTGMSPAYGSLKPSDRTVLTEMAWRSNADGAAYFASMVSQDFPVHAAELDWLLPNNVKLITPFSRSLLLRNVLADIIGEWRNQKITEDTLRRLEKLLILVRYAKNHPKAARENTAETLSQLAQHLGKLINRHIPLPEKSLSRLWERTDSNSRDHENSSQQPYKALIKDLKEEGGISTNFSSLGDFSEVSPASAIAESNFNLDSNFESPDKAVVQLAIELQLKLLKLANRSLWHETDYPIRNKLLNTVRWSLSSALWNNRHIKDQGGLASNQLNQNELQVRRDILNKCEAVLSLESAVEDIASAASVVAILLYSGEEVDQYQLDRIYRIIQKKTSEGIEKQDVYTMVSTLGFFGNYLWIKNYRHGVEVKNSLDTAKTLGDQILQIYSFVVRLFEELHAKKPNPEIHRKILSNICYCQSLIIKNTSVFSESKRKDFSVESWNLIWPYLSTKDKSQLGDNEVELLCLFLQQSDLTQDKLFNNQVSELFNTIDFDRSSLGVGSIKTRRLFIQKILFDYGCDTSATLKKFVAQVGLPAQNDIIKIVLDKIPAYRITESQIDALLRVFDIDDETILFPWSQRKECLLHLWSQYLLIGRTEKMADCVGSFWDKSWQSAHYEHQMLAFDGLRLLARWTSPTDKHVLVFLSKIENVLTLPSFTKDIGSATKSGEIHTHHIHLIQLLSDLVTQGLSHGENIDVYLDLKEKAYGN